MKLFQSELASANQLMLHNYIIYLKHFARLLTSPAIMKAGHQCLLFYYTLLSVT